MAYKVSPPVGRAIAWANPLTRKLAAIVLPDEIGKWPVPRYTVVGSPAVVNSPTLGRAINFSAGSSYYEFGSVTDYTAPFTVVTSIVPVNATTQMFAGFAGSGGGHGWKIGQGTSNGVDLLVTFGGVADYTFAGFFSTPDFGRAVTIGATVDKNSGTACVYKDGVLFGTTAVDTMLAPAKPFRVGMASNGSDTDPFQGQMAYCYLWRRVLSPAEVARLARDPYQLLARKPLLYKAGASGIAITSGSAGEGEGAAGTVTEKIGAIGTAGEGEGAIGAAGERITATGGAGEGEKVSGTAGESIAGTGSAGEAEGASGAVGERIAATAIAGEAEAAAGSTTESIAATGSAGEAESGAGAVAEAMAATATAGEGEGVIGFTGNPPLTVTGTAGEGEGGSGALSEREAATGSAGQGERAAGTATEWIAATGNAGEAEGAQGALGESVAAHGTAGEAEFAQGVLTVRQPGASLGPLRGIIISRPRYAGIITARPTYAGTITSLATP